MNKHALPLIAVSLLLSTLAACSSPTAAAPTPGASADAPKGVLNVGGTGVSFPHSYKENGELIGFDTEVIREAATRAGYRAEFTTMDFPGLLGAVRSGKIDTTATNLTWTPQRAGVYAFTIAYGFDGVGLSAKKENDAIKTVDDLRGKVIATGAGTTNEAAVKAWNEATGAGVQIRSYDTSQSALQDVLLGRADAQAGPRGNVVADIAKRGLDVKTVGDLLTHEQTRFPFADTERGRTAAADISRALEGLLADGTIAKLSNKYFTYDRTVGGEQFNTPDPTKETLPEQYPAASASASPAGK